MSKEKICGIYKITSPSGKVYIGQSNNIIKRWITYKSITDILNFYSIDKKLIKKLRL